MLYELLAGRLPFDAANGQGLLRAILDDEPEPLTKLGVPDQDLWAILQRGLEKDREQRWPTIAALGQALARWLIKQGVVDDVCGGSLRAMWLHDTPARQNKDLFASIPPPPLDDDAALAARELYVTPDRAQTLPAARRVSTFNGPAIEPTEDDSARPKRIGGRRAAQKRAGALRAPEVPTDRAPAPAPVPDRAKGLAAASAHTLPSAVGGALGPPLGSTLGSASSTAAAGPSKAAQSGSRQARLIFWLLVLTLLGAAVVLGAWLGTGSS